MNKNRSNLTRNIVTRKPAMWFARRWRVLDDGFVRVVDFLGNDDAIVQAARISYGKGTKRTSGDSALIRYLMRHGHTTPFEMCEIKLHIRVPMDTWRQWVRHRTANVNEYSTRYSIAIDSFARAQPNEWRSQSMTNRQGSDSGISLEVGRRLSKEQNELLRASHKVYASRIKAGVAREQARKDLPLSTYTEAYWKIDLHNLLRFLALRMDSHAQQEIREYANIIGRKIVASWCPVAWQAFIDYNLESMTLSRQEVEYIRLIMKNKLIDAREYAKSVGWFRGLGSVVENSREGIDVASKLGKLGLDDPLTSTGYFASDVGPTRRKAIRK